MPVIERRPQHKRPFLGIADIMIWEQLTPKSSHTLTDTLLVGSITASISKSLAALEISNVHIMFCHRPDHTQPLESVCASMAKGIINSRLEHWGILKYSIYEMQRSLSICEEKVCQKPVVCQGQCYAFTGMMEEHPVPFLRKQRGIPAPLDRARQRSHVYKSKEHGVLRNAASE